MNLIILLLIPLRNVFSHSFSGGCFFLLKLQNDRRGVANLNRKLFEFIVLSFDKKNVLT